MDERGFSLIEMMLSVAIIGLLAGLSLPVYVGFVGRNDLDISAQDVATALRRAQTYARGVQGDSQWGVEIVSNQIVLFKGATYASRDTTYDEMTVIPGSITTSGLTDITFAKLIPTPSTTGTITLTSNASSARTITINGKGMVTY